MRLVLAVMMLLTFLFACSKSPESGIDTSGFDKSVRAQDDFYQYVNGTWLEKTEIPADKSNYGAFTALHDKAQLDLRQIIEEAALSSDKKAGSDEQKVGDFYLSYMDSVSVEQRGIEPLTAEIEQINSLKSRDELPGLFAHYKKLNIQIPFTFWINQDLKQSDRYIGYINQSGLGLPDRDYYLREDEKFKNIRTKYLQYLTGLMNLGGIDSAAEKAGKIMQMEQNMAQGHWTRTENRDRDKTYNKFTVKQLDTLTPSFSWTEYVHQADLGDSEEIIIRQPSYIKHLDGLYSQYSLADWKDYLIVKLLSGSAPLLTKDFVDLQFDFYGKTLSGTEVNQPRWKRAVEAIDGILGEVVGKVYVSKHFRPEAKTRMVQLVENLRHSYAERIKQLDWMSEETKQEALKKLAKFNAKIGYPDKWKDYSSLVIKKDDLVGNYKRSNLVEYQREINKLGKPIDRDEWFMTPQTVNAYYNPPMNEVVFPAAILQPPFFNMAADDAVNYGAIGAVIGHELTHGFDDQGRKSDGEGNLRDWWTEDDERQFKERSDKMVAQYHQYTPIDTMHLNGQLTLGENIADLGGLTIAYYAYKMSLDGKEGPVIDSLSGDQRFFAGWAQVWRRKYRDEELRNRILTDPHSPSRYRVLGIVSNMPEFYAAFDLSEKDKLYLNEDQRIKIW
jgi:predicted metalloendopeptidase